MNRPLPPAHDNKLTFVRENTPELNDKVPSMAANVETQATVASEDESKVDARAGGIISRGWGQLTPLMNPAFRPWLSFAADVYLCEWWHSSLLAIRT
jgi:hypothetical protein